MAAKHEANLNNKPPFQASPRKLAHAVHGAAKWFFNEDVLALLHRIEGHRDVQVGTIGDHNGIPVLAERAGEITNEQNARRQRIVRPRAAIAVGSHAYAKALQIGDVPPAGRTGADD